MQALIYQATLRMERSPSWLTPGDPLELELAGEEVVAVIARRAARWPFRGEKRVRIGTLREQATMIAVPLIASGTRIRVRIVALVPAHLTPDRETRVAVSVWGDVRGLY